MLYVFRRHAPLFAFVVAYLVTVVLGNVLYLFPFAGSWPGRSIPAWSGHFPFVLGPTFWVLLLLPLLLAPLVVIYVSRLSERLASRLEPAIPEIPLSVFVLIYAAIAAYVGVSLYRAGAFDAVTMEGGARQAVLARFELFANLPFLVALSLKSVLVFLSAYAVVRANRYGGWRWAATAFLATALTSAFMFFLDAKWPLILFIVIVAAAVFVSGKWHVVLTAGAVLMIGIAAYFLVSVYVLRLDSSPSVSHSRTFASQATPTDASRPDTSVSPASVAHNILHTSVTSAPMLMIAAVNRMAVAAPYYFSFPNEHPECKENLPRLWIKRELACEPTLLVYEDLFGRDGFAGVGTAPAAVNLYGYALDGWTGAVVSVALASIVLGLFVALWPAARDNSIYATGSVMGVYAGYSFSQLPVEGALVYDHGMWWALLVIAWAFCWWTWRVVEMRTRSIRRSWARHGLFRFLGKETVVQRRQMLGFSANRTMTADKFHFSGLRLGRRTSIAMTAGFIASLAIGAGGVFEAWRYRSLAIAADRKLQAEAEAGSGDRTPEGQALVAQLVGLESGDSDKHIAYRITDALYQHNAGWGRDDHFSTQELTFAMTVTDNASNLCSGLSQNLHWALDQFAIPNRYVIFAAQSFLDGKSLGDTHQLIEARIDGRIIALDPTFSVTYCDGDDPTPIDARTMVTCAKAGTLRWQPIGKSRPGRSLSEYYLPIDKLAVAMQATGGGSDFYQQELPYPGWFDKMIEKYHKA